MNQVLSGREHEALMAVARALAKATGRVEIDRFNCTCARRLRELRKARSSCHQLSDQLLRSIASAVGLVLTEAGEG